MLLYVCKIIKFYSTARFIIIIMRLLHIAVTKTTGVFVYVNQEKIKIYKY